MGHSQELSEFQCGTGYQYTQKNSTPPSFWPSSRREQYITHLVTYYIYIYLFIYTFVYYKYYNYKYKYINIYT